MFQGFENYFEAGFHGNGMIPSPPPQLDINTNMEMPNQIDMGFRDWEDSKSEAVLRNVDEEDVSEEQYKEELTKCSVPNDGLGEATTTEFKYGDFITFNEEWDIGGNCQITNLGAYKQYKPLDECHCDINRYDESGRMIHDADCGWKNSRKKYV